MWGKNKQLDRIEKKLNEVTARLTVMNNSLNVLLKSATTLLNGDELASKSFLLVLKALDRIEIELKESGVPTKFIVTITNQKGEHNMNKATVNFQLLDNGTALLKATPVDAAGMPATLPAGTPAASWQSSDPGLVITVNANDPTGLSATAAPATPPVPVSGAFPTVSVTLTDGTTIIGTGAPIDVVGGPATGFQVQESAS